MRNVILGIDPGEHRMGIGVVNLDDGKGRKCWSVDISEKHRPMMSYRFQRIRAALVDHVPMIGRPAILVVENNTFSSMGKAQAYQWGGIHADIVREVATIWPSLGPGQAWSVSATGWKKETGTKQIHHSVIKEAKKRRTANVELIGGRAVRMGFDVPLADDGNTDYDAAAAGLIALYGFITNERQEDANGG